MPKTKKNIKVRDLKPKKDAKGGGGRPPHEVQGRGPAVSGHQAPQGGQSVQGTHTVN